VKKAFWKDERYPVYGLGTFDPKYLPLTVVEVSDELWNRYLEVEQLYDEMQQELAALPKENLYVK
jgi:hypothetical protein